MPLCSMPCIFPSWPLSLDSWYMAHKTDLVSRAEAGLYKNLKDNHREKKETSGAGQRLKKGILLFISPLKDQIHNHQRHSHLPFSFVTEVGATRARSVSPGNRSPFNSLLPRCYCPSVTSLFPCLPKLP